MRLPKKSLKPHCSLYLNESAIQFVMNVPGDFVDSISQIREHLIAQVASPTQWEKGIRLLEDVDLYIEIGPGKTLSGMNKKIGVERSNFEHRKSNRLIQLETFI